MMLKDRSPESKYRLALASAVFLLFLFYLLAPLNIYLYNSLRGTYYAVAVPIVTAATLAWRRLRDGPEWKLLVLYWLCFILTRLINRNLALVEDQYLWFDLALILPMFALGLALGSEGRRRFLNLFTAVTCGVLFLLGLLALLAFVLRLQIINPITGGFLASISDSGHKRLIIADTNPGSYSFWFLGGVLLMVYQFFACRHKLWRIPIVLCALLFLAVAAVSFARSVWTALAVTIALLAVLLCARVLKLRKPALRFVVLAVLFLLTALVVERGIHFAAEGMTRLSASLSTAQPSAVSQEIWVPHTDAAVPEDGEWRTVVYPALSDSLLYRKLNKLSTYRLEIYACALRTIQVDPLILLRGCLAKDSMSVTNVILASRGEPIPHYHNFLLQVLILTGLPGLVLVLAFWVLLLRKGFRLFFSRDKRIPLAARTLLLIPLASLIYGMFEACFFTDTDVRTLFFFLMSGMLMGRYYELYPGQ